MNERGDLPFVKTVVKQCHCDDTCAKAVRLSTKNRLATVIKLFATIQEAARTTGCCNESCTTTVKAAAFGYS